MTTRSRKLNLDNPNLRGTLSPAAKEVALQRGLSAELEHVNRALGTHLRIHRGPHSVWYLSDDKRPHEAPHKVGGATHVSAALRFVSYLADVDQLPATVVMRGNPNAQLPHQRRAAAVADANGDASNDATVCADASASERTTTTDARAYSPAEMPRHATPPTPPPFYDELECDK